MFSNFLYFIIVLLIYSFYQPPEINNLGQVGTLFLFSALTLIFAIITYVQFRTLERQVTRHHGLRLDHRYSILITRQSILSIILFALDIYWLNLPMIFRQIPFLKALPTLEALLFLALFMFFLIIIWSCAHRSHNLLQGTKIPLKDFLVSHISFSIPVLIPFLLLSGIQDIIFILPFDSLKLILSTPLGEAGYFMLFLFIVVIIGPLLIQKSWGCKPLEKGIERTRIEAFCQKANLEFAEILTWPLFGGRMITAGVMGLVRKFRYLLVTPALLQFLDPQELDAVIAHEIGHVKKKHLVFYLFFLATLILTVFHLQILISQVLLAVVLNVKSLSFLMDGQKGRLFAAIPSFEIFLFIFLCAIYFRYIFGYFMRNFEREADIHVYEFWDNAGPLISSFKKIVTISGQSPEKPNWHHFSIKERVDYLIKCDTDRRWITHHQRKVKISIVIYLVGIIVINSAGYVMRTGETGKKLNVHLVEALISLENIEKSDNPEFLLFAGDYHYQVKKNYPNAIYAYEKAIAINPDHPDVLNNLAWLFVTCEDKVYQNPERALYLAKRATELKNAIYILDTLAESYYVNGNYEEALGIGKQALELAGPKDDRFYYKKQLKKFENAVGDDR